MIKNFNLFFLTFFFIGKFRYAPGTIASFFTCILFLLMISIIDLYVIFFITLIIFIYSFYAINNSFDEFKSDDPQEIVIDEVVGQMLVLLSLPIYETLYPLPLIYYCIGSFILFRFFDIWKPYPVNYVDDNVSGPLGIMLDDIFASFYSILILCLIFFFLGG
tara:strand:- start:707 stop:1192 length:486 start_codon:yes stop_codon:yes gene_type:complete